MSTYPAPPPMHHRFLTVRLPTLETPGSTWVVPGFRGKIRKIHTVIHGALTVANAVITAEIGGVLVTGSSITIAFTSSAAGDVDSATPTGANTFTPVQAIEIITDGGPTAGAEATVTLELEPV